MSEREENKKKLLLTPLEKIDDALLEQKGFKCGLEIHRRMRGRKLFCECSAHAINENAKEVGKVKRFMRLGEGEEGEVDQAAKEEVSKNKIYEYVVYDNGVCLVDLDEEPPHNINPDALEYAVKTAKLLHCYIPKEILFMRKIVVDGSNTSGFQRTAVVGLDGYLKTSKGDIGIQSVCLEEESAQIISKEENKVVYDLRRLGIPLIEIATTPNIKNGEQCKEVAKEIGDLLKYTFYYQRGLGSIRQDINISIKDGARVEIKGVQDIDMIPTIVKKEVQRQLSWIEFSKKFNKQDYLFGDIREVTNYFTKTSSKLFKKSRIFMFPIYNASSLFSLYLTETRTIGNEIASRLRAKTKLKGMVHTDEDLKKYQISEEVDRIKREFELYGALLVFFVTDDKSLALKGKEVVEEAFNLLFLPPQKETRKVNDKGDTEYMRPLPGSARMYPETDVPPIDVSHLITLKLEEVFTKEKIQKLISNFLDFDTDKNNKNKITNELMASPYLESYIYTIKNLSSGTELHNKLNANMKRDITQLYLNKFKEWEREYSLDFSNYKEEIYHIIKYYINNKISKEAIPLILTALINSTNPEERLNNKDIDKKIEQIMSQKNLYILDNANLHQKIIDEIEEYIKSNKISKDAFVQNNKIRGRFISLIREKLKYRANPRDVISTLNNIIKEIEQN